MHLTRSRAALAATLATAAAASLLLVRAPHDALRDALRDALHGAPAVSPIALEAALRARDIALFRRRAAEDPHGSADLARLASLYLQRARETGDAADYRRAEDAARASLARGDRRSGGARLVLASSLLAQHRFPEALATARALVAADPATPAYRALLGEIELEMGDYDAARVTFASLRGDAGSLAVAPRLARWAEIAGAPDAARRLLYAARDQAAARADLPREQVAWFHLRVGDFELRRGHLRAAERALRDGLAVDPADPRLLAALARLAALRGEWRDAIAWGERMGERVDLATLAVMGDAHLALGEPDAAEARFRALEARAAASPEPFNRQLTLFRIEHGRELPATLALLRDEIRVRQDVYGWDQLAWALHLAGEHRAARDAAARALRMGTRDATLHFRAGMIDRALGDRDGARRHLARALALNPHFHHRFARDARQVLRALGG